VSDGLAARAWRTAARTAQAVGTAVNSRAQARASWQAGVAGAGRAEVRHGAGIRTAARGGPRAAAGLLVRPWAQGTARQVLTAGRVVGGAGRLAPTASSRPGVTVVRLSVSGTATRTGSSGRGYVVNGRNDWTTPANAAGPRNGTLASFAGNALAARSGGVEVDLPALPNKTALVITAVELRFYVRQAGTALDNGTLRMGYRTSTGSRVVLGARTANVDALTVPVVFDLTGVVGGSWTAFGTVLAGAWAEASTPALNAHTADLDAVELVVTASTPDLA
jgi:hypothetical protein